MSYEVRLRRIAQKELDAISGRDYEMVSEALGALDDPRPPRVRKLVYSDLWRIRVGRYRVVYAIDDQPQLVTVVRVARRAEDTYTRL